MYVTEYRAPELCIDFANTYHKTRRVTRIALHLLRLNNFGETQRILKYYKILKIIKFINYKMFP